MKIRTTALCAMLTLACMATAQSDTLDKAAKDGQITVAYREASVPFSYLSQGKPVGISVDITNAVVEAVKKATGKNDIKVNWQAVTTQNRLLLLINGTIDMECGSTTNNTTRGMNVDFAINHFYTGTKMLVKKSSGIKNYTDLKGKTVAVTEGTTNLQVMRKANAENNWGFEIVTPKNNVDAFLLVQNDRVAAFAMDDILLHGLITIAKNPSDYEVVGEALQIEPYACMLRKDEPKFKALVDGVIGDLMKSGQFTKLYDRWFLKPIPPVNAALGLPMTDQLKKNLVELSDKPAF